VGHPHIILLPVQLLEEDAVWRFLCDGVTSSSGLDVRASLADVVRPRRMSVDPSASLLDCADVMDKMEEVTANAAVMGCVRFMILSCMELM